MDGTISGSTFYSNSVRSNGGAVYFFGNGSLFDSTFYSNTSASSGGAISFDSNAIISNTTFYSNTAVVFGGAFYLVGSGTITNSHFYSNSVADPSNPYSAQGGAVSLNSSATILNSSFIGNYANGQAGALLSLGNIDITNTQFISNVTEAGAGAVYFADGGLGGVFSLNTVTFTQNSTGFGNGGAMLSSAPGMMSNTLFMSNTAVNNGGAVYFNAGPVFLTNTQFISNTTGESGGGAYFFAGATPKLNNVTFSKNSAPTNPGAGGEGGGAYFFDTAEIISSTFSNNFAYEHGGGAAFNDAATVISSTFTQNTARAVNSGTGGGGAFFGGNAALTATQFLSNTTEQNGGGSYFVTSATLSNTLFQNNTASSSGASGAGGGAYFNDTSTIINSNFISNTAKYFGGGVRTVFSSHITGSNFIGNNALDEGGGVYAGTNTFITGTLFSKNTATNKGGALAVEGDSAQIQRSRFIENNAGSNGGAVYYNANNDGQIINSLFASNDAGTAGAALHVENATPLAFIHNTVVTPSLSSKPAVYVNGGNVELTNTLIANYAIGIQQTSGTVSENYTLFDGVTTPRSGTMTAGARSITGTAAFFGTTDYTVTVTSYAVDNGVNAGVNSDYFNAARPQGGGFDIGYSESSFTAYPNLGITKTASASSVATNASLSYTIHISNTGNTWANGAVLSDAMPAGVTFGSGSVITPGGSGICAATGCNLGDLMPGGYATATFTVTAPSSAGVITNTAGVTVSNDSNASNNFAAVATTVTSLVSGVCHATRDDGTTVFSSADAQAVRDAIAAASSGGTVKVAGYCAGVSSGNVVTINKALTLTGGYTTGNWSTYNLAANPTTLDAQGAGRVISITGGVATTIQGLTMTNGSIGSLLSGAGVRTDGPISIIESYIFSNTTNYNAGGGYFGSSASMTDTTFMSNTAASFGGGGIFNASASMTGTTFVNNTAGQTGGGGYFGSSASMTGTTFMSNTAGLYGGGGAFLGSASMTGTTFMSNTANSNGGGGYFFASANVTGTTFMSNTSSDNGGGGFFNGIAHVTGTTFMSNTALVAGGGYFKVSANMTGTTFMSNTASFGGGSFFGDAANVVDTTFIGNIASSATHGGGGVYFNFPGARTFINVLFAHNRATKHGAALYVQLANPLNLIHVTIVSQTMPTGATEAIYVFDGTVNLTNTLIATHTVGIERVGGTASENYTLFSGVSTPYSGTITAGANSITGTAAFFDTTNYTLTDSSRAIDAGTNAGVMGDYFGNARPQGNGFDIGYAESPFMANSDLGITKTTAASSVSSGATLTYTIIISNNGMLLAPNVVMTDAMPAGVTFGSGSVITPGGSGTCAATGCNLGDLAAGAYATATFTVTAPSSAGVITNTAGVTASNDSPISNNFAAVTTTVIVASCPAVLTVDDLGDADDATPGDKTCSTSGGNCTLRAAIMEANASLACTPLTIDFSVNGTVNLNAALPNLDHPNLTIDGPGASLLTVRRAAAAASEFRIFTINESKTITIQKVTVSHGYFASSNNLGGGIQSNKGRLTLRQCVLSNNQAYSGGGLYLNGNSSSWTVIDECTIRDNVIYTSTNMVLGGGGIYVWNGTLTMTNSTVSASVSS